MPKLSVFHKTKYGGIDFRKKEEKNEFFLYLFLFVICIFFVILMFRLFQLTVVKGSYYRRLSDENHVKRLVIEARRGTVLDRKGFVLAKNTEADISTLNDRLTSKRTYSEAEAISHVIGYRQLADANDLNSDLCRRKLKLGDKVGKKGVEKLFECDLRGTNGEKLIEIDARGKYLATATIIPAVDGKTLHLSLDLDLQKKAYELLKGQKGAIVALKPITGEILTLVSSPTFNVQDFENTNTNSVQNVLSDTSKPLFNRATEGTYPPGSIFKLVIATGALEEKVITEKTIFEDSGSIKAGPLTFGNWYFLQYGKTEGPVDIVKAIRRSNDTFFYKTGEALGPEKIKKWAERFWLGKNSKSGLSESEGTIPSPFWKEETLKEQWYLGDTYNYSIGQGYVLTTPLQIARVANVFANGGYLCLPKLLKIDADNQSECLKLPISKKTIDLIREGMKQACAPGGTGWPLFDFKIKSDKTSEEVKTATNSAHMKQIVTACKTGTAESYAASSKPHAWFTAFAPFENPEITITILLEEAGQGSDVAGPLVKEMLKHYFERTQ